MYILRTSYEVVPRLIHLPAFLIIPAQKDYRRGNIVRDGHRYQKTVFNGSLECKFCKFVQFRM